VRLSLRAFVVVATAALSLSGCGNVGYYLQQARGHMAMLSAAAPATELINSSQTQPALKAQLQNAQRIRDYASDKLALPRNASYTRYADLQRPYVLWNVVATPALSLTPKQWCFIVAGCVSYRGYYDKAAAEAEVATLQAQGMDVALQGVPAYSTLGKLGWLGSYGADPLLNTFINYTEGELARLVFHELAHQVAYAADDSTFNEGFASAVEQLGVTRYLDEVASAQTKAQYTQLEVRRRDFRALLLTARHALEQVYKSDVHGAQKLASKAHTFAQLRVQYDALKQSSPAWRNTDGTPYTGYDRYFAQALNNAHLAGIATYEDKVPAFEKLFEQEGRDFAKLYAKVQTLAKLPKGQRDAALQ
jgi:predicted aminopeptidase